MAYPFKIARGFLYLSAFYVAVVTPATLFPFIVGKYAWFRGTIDLALIAFALGLLLQDSAGEMWVRFMGVFRKPLTIAVSMFVAAFLLAGFFGVDPAFSFWSNFERGEGGLQILHLYAFFMLLAALFPEEKGWRRFFGWVFAGGVLSVAYGFLAAWDVPGFIGARFSEVGFRFQASIGNSSYVAAFAIFMSFYAGYLLWSKYRARLRSAGAWALGALLALFAAAFMLAATRGAFIGLLAGLLAGGGYFVFAHRAWRKWFATGAVVLVLIVGTFVFFKNSPFVKAIPGSRIFDISLTTETFAHRTIMWGIALEGWKERSLLGWGPENYIQIFDQKLDPEYFKPAEGFGAWFDRAHSVYFDYLAETGILGLLSFLGLFVVFTLGLFKKSEDVENKESITPKALMVGVFVAYLVQGIVLFDVLPIYYNLFVMLAFASYYFSGTRMTTDVKRMYVGKAVVLPSVVAVSLAFLALAGIIFGVYAPLARARDYPRALENLSRARNAEEFRIYVDPLLARQFPIGREEVVNFLAADIADIIADGGQSEEGARWLVTYIEPHLSLRNVRHILVGGDLYYTLWKQYGGNNEYYDRAEDYYTAARTIAPKFPSALYALFDLAREGGETEKMRAAGEEILRLWPSDERMRRALEVLGA